MKKIDIGMAVSVIANLGVIAGIIFLALEIQQNSRLMSAEANYILLQNRIDDSLFNDREVAAFWVKVNSGEELDEVDQYRVDRWVSKAILNWQWEWGQFVDGNLGRQELPIAAYRNAFHGQGEAKQIDFSRFWSRYKATLNPDFVSFIEAEVIDPGPLQ